MDSRVLFEGIYLFLACWLLAQLEIQIEGPNGWAAALPTWRLESPGLLRLTNGKPVTGYHFYLTLFLIALFHLPVVLLGFSRALEARVLSAYFLTTVAWDFQWFVWNPAWGVRRYFRERVWWFPKRLAGFPVEYHLGVAASFAATAILDPSALPRWGALLGVLAALSAASVLLAERLGRSPS